MATESFEGILGSTVPRILICDLVRDESFYLRDEFSSEERTEIDLSPHISLGTIAICDFENAAEMELYVSLAAQLDDGEAKTLAIAISRDLPAATDDRKARRLYLEAGGNPDMLFGTSDFVRSWAESVGAEDAVIREVLRQIEVRSRYFPPANDANYEWWNKIMSG